MELVVSYFIVTEEAWGLGLKSSVVRGEGLTEWAGGVEVCGLEDSS